MADYALLRVIGSGGFGIVYLADDLTLHRRVAIKEYFPPWLGTLRTPDLHVAAPMGRAERYQAGLHAFVREARLLARFDHPSLVKVHHYWEANGTAYMAMPYCEGATLKDVRRSMPQPPDEAWLRRLLDALLGALEVMHAASVYHRDVSPDNIVVLPSGVPVLLDLGAARVVLPDQTRTVTAMLKPAFAPIEQYAHDTELRQGPWTDIYAVAATMAHALTGTAPPSAAARAVDDTHRPLHTRPELLQPAPGASRGYDPRWLAAIDHGLAVQPQARPQSIAAWRAKLGSLAVTVPAPIPAPAPATAPLPVPVPAPTAEPAQALARPDGAPSPAAAWRPRPDPMVTASYATRPFARGGWSRRWALLMASCAMVAIAAPQLRGVVDEPIAAAAPMSVESTLGPGEFAGAESPQPMAPAGITPVSVPVPVPVPAPTPTAAAAAEAAPVAALSPESTTRADAATASAAGPPTAAPARPATAARRAIVSAAARRLPKPPLQQCEAHRFLAHWSCMRAACNEPRWAEHPQCRRWYGRDQQQALQRRD